MNFILQCAFTAVVFMIPLLVTNGQPLVTDLTESQQALDEYNTVAQKMYYEASEIAWTFNTNITDYNEQQMIKSSLVEAKFAQESAANLSRFDTSVMPEMMKREFVKILDIGTSAQKNVTKIERLSNVLSKMESIYSKAKACLTPTECLSLEPDLTRLLGESRDYDRLLKAWTSWRDATGAKMKSLYPEFVSLSNEALRILGHADTGAYWRSWYDTPNLEEQVEALFVQLKPLYENLHAYVRRRLIAIYGKDKFPSTGQIPAHLLGNMWAQEWGTIGKSMMPFEGKQSLDVTAEMVKQNYTPLKMFQKADDFFASLGLIRMPEPFWNKSMLVKPEGRDVVCHASAWDFKNQVDFRIKQCTDVTQQSFETAHHEMGHIEYYLQYAHLPVAFRDGANPGFHEAVGDVMSLSVQTPEHMHSIGLLPKLEHDNETDINFLMSMALQKVAFLPFGYLIDQWRWSVFRGDTPPAQYNDKWWQLRCKYQGVSPPVARSSSDFDPGAKYHIPANTPYIRYFISFILQFQFHKAACNASGYTGPLHRCDIYNSTVAGKLIEDTLKLGSSKPWPDAMEKMTGQRKMDARPILEYFKPLLEFLRKENSGDTIGWQDACPTFAIPTPTPTPTPTPKPKAKVTPKPTPKPCASPANSFSFGLLIVLLLVYITLM